MGRGVEMDQHPYHRPALALTAVLTARWFFLHHAGFLQHQSQPVVRDFQAMLLSDLFVKMTHREIRIHIALEAAQPLDGTGLYPFAARSPAPLVHDRRHSPAFDFASQPAHMPGAD